MKKAYIFGSVLLVMFSIFVFTNDNKEIASQSMELSVTYQTVEELVKNSDVIVTAIVSNKPEEVLTKVDESKTLKGTKQTTNVKEVLMNQTSLIIEKNDTLSVANFNEVISTETLDSWSVFSELVEMKPGKYLLFLNKLPTEEVLFVNNTPNNIYKLKNENFGDDKSKNEFNNINRDVLETILESEVIEAISKK